MLHLAPEVYYTLSNVGGLLHTQPTCASAHDVPDAEVFDALDANYLNYSNCVLWVQFSAGHGKPPPNYTKMHLLPHPHTGTRCVFVARCMLTMSRRAHSMGVLIA